ncbi:DUF2243 domain-containing protein [Acidovorax sp. GBBC 3334]|uniref:DUF2243 domain-containing protein n=1 Tax=Acidovorax sp. GBBC 3334 TaxID=2940496 RepID=UPI002302153A|nr:DUF2243 domain-containing protein [Acidovorax sp. GBBC 3334]MDA8457136.1 DUF2243 domain-containing protein [Acidovorax sp. GBBC 3334]
MAHSSTMGRPIRPGNDAAKALAWAGGFLGFGAGGFFDGILLHQVLQWHHLLSGLRSPVLQDIRMQILADGVFHALMYAIAAAGLWKLCKSRRSFALPNGGRCLWSFFLLGFGAWHLMDAVFSHWLLGLHRIRDASTTPLAWDVTWLVLFGVLPMWIGWHRRCWPAKEDCSEKGPGSGAGGNRGAGHGRVAAVTLAIAGAALVSLQPAGRENGEVMVLFRPGISAASAMDRLAAVDARVVWADRSGALWAVRMDAATRAGQLYAQGAMLVSNSRMGLGCLSWVAAGPQT